MSRSNPTDNGTPNPAMRWFEWNGEHGVVRYYDKDAKQNVDVGSDFTFILLDELATVKGWHEASVSGIYANEVRDTRQDVLIVKAFKGGVLAEGLYKDIKDRITSKAVGGQFVTNCYIAFKAGKALVIGSMQFKGAALGAWMEFRKAHRAELLTKAVRIHGFTEGKKGRIVFRVPVLSITDLTAESNAAALALDIELQTYLTAYLSRTKRDQVAVPTAPVAHEAAQNEPPPLSDVDMAGDAYDEEPPF
jgi:hypothetical protein